MKSQALCIVVTGCLLACSPDRSDDSATTGGDADAGVAQVTGTLRYRERMVLPPGAIAEIWLLDTSLADAPAVEIAYQKTCSAPIATEPIEKDAFWPCMRAAGSCVGLPRLCFAIQYAETSKALVALLRWIGMPVSNMHVQAVLLRVNPVRCTVMETS